MDKNELKIQALLERVSQLSAQYENQAADYRVEITLLSSQYQELQKQLTELQQGSEESEEENVPVEATPLPAPTLTD